MHILIILSLGLLVYVYFTKKENKILDFFSKHALILSAIVAITATTASLFYSDVMGYTPCKMCWYARILMYPQALILVLAHIWDDVKILYYTLPLTVLGIFLEIYHYLLQFGVLQTTSCSTVGFSLSCSDRFFAEFGYITIPMMCLTAFVLLLLLGGNRLAQERKATK